MLSGAVFVAFHLKYSLKVIVKFVNANIILYSFDGLLIELKKMLVILNEQNFFGGSWNLHFSSPKLSILLKLNEL